MEIKIITCIYILKMIEHTFVLPITDNYQLQFNVNIQGKRRQLPYTWYQIKKIYNSPRLQLIQVSQISKIIFTKSHIIIFG